MLGLAVVYNLAWLWYNPYALQRWRGLQSRLLGVQCPVPSSPPPHSARRCIWFNLSSS